jgi:hypothetical protein|tara:strand:+ start:1923 stop:2423 length:501 start_codon:yes stop_codon:yes gene_type:complete
MAYFQYFPTIPYDVRGEKNNVRIQEITNVLVRIRKKINVVNTAFFEQYFIGDGDRADTLAHQLYDDSTLHWVVLYANYMTNPYYDWPLTYFDLQKFVAKKYPDNINGVHHYKDADGYEVDADASGATAVTNFVHEETLNDEKRIINVIRAEFLPQILEEFKTFIVE